MASFLGGFPGSYLRIGQSVVRLEALSDRESAKAGGGGEGEDLEEKGLDSLSHHLEVYGKSPDHSWLENPREMVQSLSKALSPPELGREQRASCCLA